METEKKKELRFCDKEQKEHSVVLVDLLNGKDDNNDSSNRSKKLPRGLTTETVDAEEEFLSCSEEDDDNNGVMENNLKKNGGHNGECSNNARSSILSKILDLLMTNSRGSAARNYDRCKKSSVFQQIQDLMKREGEHFRSSFLENDNEYKKNIHDLKTARLLFHCCSFIPMLLYYNKGTTHDHPPKFPASISYTIRRGIPHRVQMMLWLWGWSYMGRIIRRTTATTRDRIINNNHDNHDNQAVMAQTMPTTTIWLPKFVMKMVGTGIWTTILFPLGEGTHSLRETAHFLGALVYMIDHIVLFKILNVKTIYQKAFGLCFLLLTISVYGTRTIERLFGLPTESETANANTKQQQQATNHRNNNKTAVNTTTTLERQKQLIVLSPFVRKMFFYLELLLMISENLLFTTFVHGMPSGIEEEYHNIKQTKNQQEEDNNKIDNEEEEEQQPQQQKNYKDETQKNGVKCG